MLTYTDGFVKVNGVNIHYYRTGGGKPPFILLHGASDNGLCWTPVAELLEERYDVIMPDARGHGLSDRLGPDFTPSDNTAQVVSLVKELEITAPLIMGHSMGAGTTVNIAVEYPHLPKAIILEDPGWIDRDKPATQRAEEQAKQTEEFVRYITEATTRTREELIAECRQANPLWSEAEIVPWAESKLQFDPAVFSTLPMGRSSYADLVSRIACPTLLITSDGGMVTPEKAEHASRLWKSKKPFRWVQIKGAGHNIRREQFAAFCDALFAFLRDYAL
jgi:N-formylmaleamate deformylase